MYKVRIQCTSKKDLSFRNKPINKKTYREIHNAFQPETIDYIDSFVILHKTFHRFTTKSFEIILQDTFDDEQIVFFIRYMKQLGFVSRGTIQLLVNGTPILNYDFTTELCLPIKNKKYKNRSTYRTQCLYKTLTSTTIG